MKKRSLAALVFPEFELLDVFGPLEFFGLLPEFFEIAVVAESIGPVVSEQGPEVVASCALDDPGPWDLVLVPGGRGTRREVDNPRLLDCLREVATGAEIVMSVCTGSALLARAGVLDGRVATTNKGGISLGRRSGATG